MVKPTELGKSDRIVKQIESATGSVFDHYQPARYLLEHQVTLLPEVTDTVLGRFEQLFLRINALLG